jgi:hypothetical protein
VGRPFAKKGAGGAAVGMRSALMVGAGTHKAGEVHDSTHWRRRAEEARRHAAALADPVAQKALLAIAQAYEQLALNAEAHTGEPHPE